MLFISEDKKRFITTTKEGATCFTRPIHDKLAREEGIQLHELDNVTSQYYYKNKETKGGVSIKNFLN